MSRESQTVNISGSSSLTLVLNHPLSIDAARLGFRPLQYEGSAEYVGEASVVVADMDGTQRPPANLYGVSSTP